MNIYVINKARNILHTIHSNVHLYITMYNGISSSTYLKLFVKKNKKVKRN